jgi:purine-nucleoside phosphorylase
VTVAETVQAVRARTGLVPEVGIVLGTGLGALTEVIEAEAVIPYAKLPGFAVPTVESHAGRLHLGTLAGRRVAVLQGRFHRYEGYSLDKVTFPVRVLHALGAGTLIVSNVSGGMHPLWEAGDLVLLADHINLLGDNPLAGPDEGDGSMRFPDLTEAYDSALRVLARDVARVLGITLREGTYVAVAGPNLETRAEYRMLRGLGGDVVGMSTVPEVIVARQLGMRVLGLSIITDLCLPDALEPASVEQILAVARVAEPRLAALVQGIIPRLN